MARISQQQPTGRAQVLQRLVEHVRAYGLPAAPSLRYYAEELGTSHRMLAYYFGSREGMLATVLGALRADERESLWSTAQAWSLRDAAIAMWSHYTDPARRPEHQAFFYVFSRALSDPDEFTDFLASLHAWVDLTHELAVAEGDDPTHARRRAQLVVSTVRGLLIDRLVAPDTAAVDAAFQEFLTVMFEDPAPVARRRSDRGRR